MVDAASTGVRLDAFLTARQPTLSRSRIKALIESAHATVDGAPAKPSARMRAGQRVEIVVPPREPATVTPQDIPLDIVFEDDALLVINKPPGLTVHPGAGQPSGTMVNAIVSRLPQLLHLGGGLRPGIVHRLDKDTSGLLVVAKTDHALRDLQQQVASRTMRRVYLALVQGRLPHDEGTVDAPIGRDPRHRTRMAVVRGGRQASTRYRVIERMAAHTLVEASLVTGRTHQIRVHLAHLRHPVAGDPVYGGRAAAGASSGLGLTRQALHAYRLRFRHPTIGAEMVFEAAPPADFTGAVARARAEGVGPTRRNGRTRR